MVTYEFEGDQLPLLNKKLERILKQKQNKGTMTDLSQNFVVRFKSITKKKDGIYANFKVKGIRGGAQVTASIAVDISDTETTVADPLEDIIDQSATIAVREFKKSECQFEGMALI